MRARVPFYMYWLRQQHGARCCCWDKIFFRRTKHVFSALPYRLKSLTQKASRWNIYQQVLKYLSIRIYRERHLMLFVGGFNGDRQISFSVCGQDARTPPPLLTLRQKFAVKRVRQISQSLCILQVSLCIRVITRFRWDARAALAVSDVNYAKCRFYDFGALGARSGGVTVKYVQVRWQPYRGSTDFINCFAFSSEMERSFFDTRTFLVGTDTFKI